jgi:hypothetical protein
MYCSNITTHKHNLSERVPRFWPEFLTLLTSSFFVQYLRSRLIKIYRFWRISLKRLQNNSILLPPPDEHRILVTVSCPRIYPEEGVEFFYVYFLFRSMADVKRKEFTEYFLLKVKPVLILVFIAGQRPSLRGQSHEILYFLTSTNINLYFFSL